MTDLGSEQTGSKYAISEASSGFFVVQAFSWKALNVLLSRYSFQEDSLSLMTTFPSEDSRFKEAKFIHFLVGAFPRTTLDSIFLLTISGSSLSVLNSPPPKKGSMKQGQKESMNWEEAHPKRYTWAPALMRACTSRTFTCRDKRVVCLCRRVVD